MRYIAIGVVMLVLGVGAICEAQTAVSAGERPLASLVPADVNTYSELNLDRMLGRTPETEALGEAFANMQSLRVIRQMLAHDPETAEVVEEVLEVLSGLSEVLGPRICWATRLPNMESMLGGMMGGYCGADPEAAMAMAAKVLVVADVRDGARLDELQAHIIGRLEIPAEGEEREGALRVTTFAEGMVALVRGEDWLALSFPSELAQEAADRAEGRVTRGSLWSDSAYQVVRRGLPEDAVFTQYVSSQAVRQLVGMVQTMMPAVEFSPPEEEGLGWAMGVRVEELTGRQMVTTYVTADLDTLPYLLDAPIALQAAMLLPVFTRARESAQKAVCLVNVKNLALAVQMYLVDCDDVFPPADGWVDALRRYVHDEDALRCPADKSGARCSYAMNRALAGRHLDTIEDPASAVVFYETADPGHCPVGSGEDVASPGRHLDGNNYAFVDGHVIWMAEVPDFEVK